LPHRIWKIFLQGNEYLKIFPKKKFLFTCFSQKKFTLRFHKNSLGKVNLASFFSKSCKTEKLFQIKNIYSWLGNKFLTFFVVMIFRMDEGFVKMNSQKIKRHRFHLKLLKFLDEKINSPKKISPRGRRNSRSKR